MKVQNINDVNKFSDGTIEELEIIAYEPEDAHKLLEFMMRG